MRLRATVIVLAAVTAIALAAVGGMRGAAPVGGTPYDHGIRQSALKMLREGQQTFRHDTFGDEQFWGDTLRLHEAIEGADHGGTGPGLTPRTALALGLKVDVDALPTKLRKALGNCTKIIISN